MSTLRLFLQISVFLLALSGCGENTSDNDTASSAVATENCETSIASNVPLPLRMARVQVAERRPCSVK